MNLRQIVFINPQNKFSKKNHLNDAHCISDYTSVCTRCPIQFVFIFTSIYHASSALITSHFCANFILTIQLNVDLFFRNFNSPIVRIAMQENCDRLNSTDEWRNQFHLISQLIEQKSVCIFI